MTEEKWLYLSKSMMAGGEFFVEGIWFLRTWFFHGQFNFEFSILPLTSQHHFANEKMINLIGQMIQLSTFLLENF